MNRSSGNENSGFVLAAVLVVVMLSSMLAISLLFKMRAEQSSSAAAINSSQAWSTALSGIQQAIQVVSVAEPGSVEWLRAPTLFHHQLVADDGSDQWFYTIYSKGETEDEPVRFGLTDEASKLHLIKSNFEMLQKVTQLPEQQLNSLAMLAGYGTNTWTDSSDAAFFFFSLQLPVHLDQLSTLPGFSPYLIYGEDANMNHQLDPNEDDGEALPPLDNKDGVLDSGLIDLITLVSYERNVNEAKADKVDINKIDAPWPGADLPPAAAQFILAAQKNKFIFKHPADLLLLKQKFKGEDGKEVEMDSGVDENNLAVILDFFTAEPIPQREGLINVNTASSRVLQALPEVDESLAEAIVNTRNGLPPERKKSIAWLYQEKVVEAEHFKKLAPIITTQSSQFSFKVIGYGLPSGAYRILEVVIDLAGASPKVITMRDLTRLGLPFQLPSREDSGDNTTMQTAPMAASGSTKGAAL